MNAYDPAHIEPKWQAYWHAQQTFRTPEHINPGQPCSYILDMFPYPSGAGLHVGHPEGYTATDILARTARARGHAVLHPMGWDAFGLPAEQHAIRTGTHPRHTTASNIDNFKRQLQMLGFSYDWEREINTTDPGYVKWTQWIFLRLFKRGLAYQAEVPVNWCPALGTVLANEEVNNGVSDIGGHPVKRVALRQWMLRITAYAERLLEDLQHTQWPESTRRMQQEWIGQSKGAALNFALVDAQGPELQVFTTRADTLYGVSFLAIAPEHPQLDALAVGEQREATLRYRDEAKGKSERERQANQSKSGVFTGSYAKHPLSGEGVPIWVADYVLWGYGTGAVMGVPAHDSRDFEFARLHHLPIRQVVRSAKISSDEAPAKAYTGKGIAMNSGEFDGLDSDACAEAIIAELSRRGCGEARVEYKLRDWVFSRQRYWGEPIPILFPVHCEGDPRQRDDYRIDYSQPIACEESDLPVQLPDLDDFRPGDDPAGPLARAREWRFVQRNGQWFARETNTMPQWAGSCWYYLRYLSPKLDSAAWDADAAKRWLPVSTYIGGAEHAVLHLLYARFWHKVLYDEGLITSVEPFHTLVHQGMILGEVEYSAYRNPQGQAVSREHLRTEEGKRFDARNGNPLEAHRLETSEVSKNKEGDFVLKCDPSIVIEARAHKMSKSRGNVVNPDEIVREFGADAMRVYEMFMGPLEATKPWNTQGMVGIKRFLDRSYTLLNQVQDKVEDPLPVQQALHRATRKVSEDIDALRFNTAISTLMVLSSTLAKQPALSNAALSRVAQLLHPFAPHLAEEMWEKLGHAPSIQHAGWPTVDPALCEDLQVEVPVQINGKVRGRITLAKEATQDEAYALAQALPKVADALNDTKVRKIIWVPGKILNLIL